MCHLPGPEDKEGRDAYYPRIAGKPEGYLFNQLRNFRDGRRHYRPMALLLEGLPDQYLRDMAAYFASLKQAFPPPEPMTLLACRSRTGPQAYHSGRPRAGKFPPASNAMVKDLMGTAPFIPGLLGLPRVYIIAQFGNWQNGGLMRGQTPDCMSEIAKQLTTDEASAIATWLAAQPVSEALLKRRRVRQRLSPTNWPERCSSIVLQLRRTAMKRIVIAAVLAGLIGLGVFLVPMGATGPNRYPGHGEEITHRQRQMISRQAASTADTGRLSRASR